MYRLFSAEHSMFSAKVRAYLRFKHSQHDLGPGYEDILATPELMFGLLAVRSGSPSLPQLEAPDGTWIQDSSEIIDYCESRHSLMTVIPPLASRPKQRLTTYLLELISDEWLIVPACWERWFYSVRGREPNHRPYNELQWGSFLAPQANGKARRAAGADFFENVFGISDVVDNPKGPYAGLVQLGCTQETQSAWQNTKQRILQALEIHLEAHDFILGGRPSLADYSLLGPVYVHFYRDPVDGFYLRNAFPLVCEWVERTNAESCMNARRYGQRLYILGPDGSLIGREAMSDNGSWLPDDLVPATLEPVISTFFDEMWPFLRSSMEALKTFIASGDHVVGGELPRKSFSASPGFEPHQTGEGPLTVPFSIGGITSRRMVAPIQIWKLQRMEAAMDGADRQELEDWLKRFRRGPEILDLRTQLSDCRINKVGGRLLSVPR
jgi:glutathione S-transferase